MRSLPILAALAVLLFGSASALTDPTEKLDGVHDLDPDTFDKHVNGGKLAIVEFYAPWCGHCKHLTPEYKKLGAAVAADPALATRVVVAKVDADQHRSLGERFAVRGFPTIKLFRRGQPVTGPEDYAGARTADAMLAHVKSVLAADRGHARVAALDALKPATAPVAKLEAAAKKLEGQDAAHGALYVSIAKKGAAKGEGWFAKEAARVERLLGSGAVGGARLQELTTKLSVLSAFVGEEDGAAAAA